MTATQKKMDCGVYAITHVDSRKRYIGSSRTIGERLTSHRNFLNKNKHSNSHLQGAWNKYGASAFQCSKLLVCSKEDRLFYEQLCLDGFKTIDREYGFNIRLKAECAKDSHSPETLEKIRIAVRKAYAEGRVPGHRTPHTEETKKLISEIVKKRPYSNKGKKFSQKARENMRKSKLAQYKDPIFLAKHNARKATHCKRGHSYSGENLYTAPDGERGCRACMRKQRKEWNEKNREKYLALRKAKYERWKLRKKK